MQRGMSNRPQPIERRKVETSQYAARFMSIALHKEEAGGNDVERYCRAPGGIFRLAKSPIHFKRFGS
jgi:hypothetical protein